jgi:hypothetical protein
VRAPMTGWHLVISHADDCILASRSYCQHQL